MINFIAIALLSVQAVQPDLPTVTLFQDDTVIDKSCRVMVPPGTMLVDGNNNGVIQVMADGITIEFIDGQAEILGGPKGMPWDECSGFGIVIDGFKDVTIRNAHTHRFKVGIYAKNADGLTLENCDVAGGYAQHLKSTPVAEDGSDWLWPHNNTDNEWMNNYGAAICVEESDNVTIKGCSARRRQNGIILDGVTNSNIYDNDFSFLSGWGLAMWKSSDNVISRNRFDFCVRGYSHGVYNRGQDSAGILMFEQNNRNVIAENSVTHGGDGFFGFGGKEALGEGAAEGVDLAEFKRRGNNDNLLIGNDLSYAPAHGIEMTFSFGNQFINNRIVGNAICGIWGGYSQETLIAGNEFTNNGEMGYGLERGGVNIEHGAKNQIISNVFSGNRCGVHLWWDPDNIQLPWAKANHSDGAERWLPSLDNTVAGNTFDGDELALHLRDVDRTSFFANDVKGVGELTKVEGESELITSEGMAAPSYLVPEYQAYGERRPVGAHPELRGRDKIVMTEWFPWDHKAPLVRLSGTGEDGHVYELFNLPGKVSVSFEAKGMTHEVVQTGDGVHELRITPIGGGRVFSYEAAIESDGFKEEVRGTIVKSTWEVKHFAWDEKSQDPREELDAWRALADEDSAFLSSTGELVFRYGGGGPRNLELNEQLTKFGPGSDYFGTIARTRVAVPEGRWKVVTTSDDGVRVLIDGEPVIENWTWHGPTRDEGVFELDQRKVVEIVVEHFEINGFAVLEFGLEPAVP